MWLNGSKQSQILSDRRTFGAQDLEFIYSAPTEDHAEDDNELNSKGHGNGAHEPHRSEGALYSAWRDKESPKLIRTKERAPPTTHPHSAERFA